MVKVVIFFHLTKPFLNYFSYNYLIFNKFNFYKTTIEKPKGLSRFATRP